MVSVRGDTLLLTDRGEFSIGVLVDKKVNIWNGEEYFPVKIKEHRVEDLYRIHVRLFRRKTGNSYSRYIDCGLGHKWRLTEKEIGGRDAPLSVEIITTRNLSINRILYPWDTPVVFRYPNKHHENFLIEKIEDLIEDEMTFTIEPETNAILNRTLTGIK